MVGLSTLMIPDHGTEPDETSLPRLLDLGDGPSGRHASTVGGSAGALSGG